MTTKSEIQVMATIDTELNAIDAEVKVRVLNWVNSKHLGISSPTPKPAIGVEQIAEPQHSSPTKNKSAKSKPPKKSKNIIKQVKELNLHPAEKKSALDFVAEKQPTNAKQKCIVALHYLLNTLELEKAGIDHIYTFFKGVNWPIPENFANTLHQAGSQGWLDTKDSTDYKITSSGENEVEHNLPKKIKVQA